MTETISTINRKERYSFRFSQGVRVGFPWHLFQKKGLGFTLIELMVVIAIIGILASFILISLSSTKVKARDARRKIDLHQIQAALEMYHIENKQYPYSDIAVVEEWEASTGCGGSYITISTLTYFLKDLVNEELFGNLPRDSINDVDHSYLYVNWSIPLNPIDPGCTNNSQQFGLITLLEKEQPVGGDSDCDPAIPPPFCVYVIIGVQNP